MEIKNTGLDISCSVNFRTSFEKVLPAAELEDGISLGEQSETTDFQEIFRLTGNGLSNSLTGLISPVLVL